MNSLLSSNIKIVLLLSVLSVSHTFSQVNDDFSWVNKKQIKTVKITSPEESDRKEFEEIFEYDLNGALVRHELIKGWLKYIKEFNHQGFIELEAELVRFDSELFFDTADVTYFEYDDERIKKKISQKFDALKGGTSKELSYESISSWYYEPQIVKSKHHYHDYSTGFSESYELIRFLNIHDMDSLEYFILGNGDTLTIRMYDYKYDNQGRKCKSIEKYISNDKVSIYKRTFEYRGQSMILSSEKKVHYNEDNPSKITKTLYKYSLNGNIKLVTEIDKSGEKVKNKRLPPKQKYDLKTRLKKARKTDKIVNIIYHYN